MKRFLLIIIILLTFIQTINGEPYRPYPLILVHGYNANNAKSSNFGLRMKRSKNADSIKYQIKASPYKIEGTGEFRWGDAYFVSKFYADSIEEDKLAYRCLETNQQIIEKWQKDFDQTYYGYWLNGDTLNKMASYLTHKEPPHNIFLETIEFDWPGISAGKQG